MTDEGDCPPLPSGGPASAVAAPAGGQEAPLSTGRCGYCLQRLGQPLHVACAVCPGLKLCLRCFTLGAEGGKHQRCHDYKLVGSGARDSVFRGSGWTWDEETRLLDSVDAFGFGNWTDVGARVLRQSGSALTAGSGGGKTAADAAEQCRRHYELYYIRGCLGNLLPRQPAASSAAVEDLTPRPEEEEEEETEAQQRSLSLATDLTPEESQRLGLMPLRDFEFEREMDHDAEAVVCRLQPCFESDPLDSALRIAQIDAYRQRLRARSDRRRLIRRHGLLPAGLRRALAETAATATPPGPPGAAAAASTASPLKRRPHACGCDAFASADPRLRPFLRYLEPPDCRQLVECMAKAESIRAEMAQLSRLWDMGIRRLPDSLAASVVQFNSDAGGSAGDCASLPVLTRNGTASSPPPQQLAEQPRLTEPELQLCHRLRLSVESYQVMKLSLLAQSGSNGHAAVPAAVNHPGLLPLVAFFHRQGWLSI